MPLATSVDGPAKASFETSIMRDDVFEIALRPCRSEVLRSWGDGEKPGDFLDIHRSVFFGDAANPLLQCIGESQFVQAQFIEPTKDDELECLAPVIFHGESGTGKSTLACLLATQLAEQLPRTDDQTIDHATYFTGSDFYRFYLAANERQNLDEFRQRILGSRGVLIDDLDQLAERYAAQRELIFLIDQLRDLKKPFIATMKNSPWAISAGILQPLTSRLGSGLLFPVHPPGPDARKAILEHLSSSWNLPLTAAAIDWVTKRLPVTFPKLNHFFVQLRTELNARNIEDTNPIDVATLAVIFRQDTRALETMACQILDIVAAEFQLDATTLKSQSRKQTAVAARGIAIWLERTMVGTSFKKIGVRYGNRDHTTVMHSFQKFDAMVADREKHASASKEANFVSRIASLQQRLNEAFAGQMTIGFGSQYNNKTQ